MASIFYRGKPPAGSWSIQFYHPHSGELKRFTLATGDKYAAEQIRRRVELEIELRRPELALAVVPSPILQCLEISPLSSSAALSLLETPAQQPVAGCQVPPSALPIGQPKTTIKRILTVYWETILEENTGHHQAGKLSILRHFFGWNLVFEVTSVKCRTKPEAYFVGEYLHEITTSLVREFVKSRNIEPKTRGHYRELFHHFFEVALRNGLFAATNIHTPNPMAGLPHYSVRKRKPIVFLNPEQVEEQFAMLRFCPSRHAAAQIMINAGLRRSEALWLTRDAIHNMEYLSVVTRHDPESDPEDDEEPDIGTMKTEGSTRTVTILPPLRKFLEEYLPTLKGQWLVPNPWKEGERWEPDNFSSSLGKYNRKNGLIWNSLHYRHTYATNRASEGWPVFDLANEMGTSVAMIQRHYAGFLRPAMLQRQALAESGVLPAKNFSTSS